jgi:hypothetical protein
VFHALPTSSAKSAPPSTSTVSSTSITTKTAGVSR